MLPGKDVGDDGPGADWAVDGSAADTGGGADKSPAAKSWILTAGGSSLDFGRTIVVDASGNAHFTAEFEGNVAFGARALTAPSGGYATAVVKVDPSGKVLWAVSPTGSEVAVTSSALDAQGNLLVSGSFKKKVTMGSTTLTSKVTATSGGNAFVAKLDSAGKWVWARAPESTAASNAEDVAVDAKGDVTVVGKFSAKATFGAVPVTSGGGIDLYVARYDLDGKFGWVKTTGSTGVDIAHSVGLDSSGDAVVAGTFHKTVKFGGRTLSSTASSLFVAKMDGKGGWKWASAAKGIYNSVEIAVDNTGGTFITGRFDGAVTFGTGTLTSKGSSDIFVTRMDKDGKWSWATSAGGTQFDRSLGIDLDGAGGAAITGSIQGSASFGSASITSKGKADGYVAAIDSAGKWGKITSFSGAGDVLSQGIDIHGSAGTFAVGSFTAPVAIDGVNLTSKGSYDIFAAKLK